MSSDSRPWLHVRQVPGAASSTGCTSIQYTAGSGNQSRLQRDGILPAPAVVQAIEQADPPGALVDGDFQGVAGTPGSRRLHAGLAELLRTCQDRGMVSTFVSELIELPAAERVELAMALWDSLSDAERDAEFALTPERGTELDRRWAAHLEDPSSAVPWSAVRQSLRKAGNTEVSGGGPVRRHGTRSGR